MSAVVVPRLSRSRASTGSRSGPSLATQQQQYRRHYYHDDGSASSSGSSSQSDRYKTELCRSWEETKSCRYGQKCQFAHGSYELRELPRHPKYKTELCKNYHARGHCPYATRCRFIHDELDTDKQLLAALGPTRVADLRRMMLEPSLLESPMPSPAASPVTSPRPMRRTRSTPVSPLMSPLKTHAPEFVPASRRLSPAPAPAPAPAVVAAAASPAIVITGDGKQFELVGNVRHVPAALSQSSQSSSATNSSASSSDDSSGDAGSPKKVDRRSAVARSSPRLAPTRLFVDRTEPPQAKSAPSLSPSEARDIDMLVAELSTSLETDSVLRARRGRARSRLPIFQDIESEESSDKSV
eukprot:TRINITY_DN3410_c0_g1_i4.p1 TRINITY_DN3410_c0_g1~~TRINITY_DN3410_c0_g1_i4.p1  ORF type:complete len:368 (-),score=114.14 TRINITY_DN3410_c0_g1_i4:29-1090(-)